jgi:hypothetical protein
LVVRSLEVGEDTIPRRMVWRLEGEQVVKGNKRIIASQAGRRLMTGLNPTLGVSIRGAVDQSDC